MNILAGLPFYVKVCLNLVSICLIATILYLGQGILVPLFFSILLATLLLPVTNFLQRIKIPKVAAILIAIFVSLAIIATIIYFLSRQISIFLADIDTIKERLAGLVHQFQGWIDDKFNISERRQNQYIEDTAENIKNSGAGIVGRTFTRITESLSYLVFLPVYTFLILFYNQARTIGRDYVLGLFIDMSIVFTLNSVGFLILGIKYPIFLALVAAILNLIPYIGMLIANVFAILITIVTSDTMSDAVWVAAVLAAVQFIDNNFLMPMIVGNKVRINALVTIIGVVLGGTLCGVGGMFLAIPAVATMKVIFDNVPDLEPWGMLLGDDVKGKEKETKPIR
jgi:predicted PurR-regulated permease PerM